MSKADFEHWWIANEAKTTGILLALRSGYGNVIDIDDLKSETFLRCWASNPRPSNNGYVSWIWTVAKSILGDVLRQIKKDRQATEGLIEQITFELPAKIVIDRITVGCRIAILSTLYDEWGVVEREGRTEWDKRLTKRKVIRELAERVISEKSISSKAVAEAISISPQYVRRLLNEIASEILEIEDAEVQSVRC